MTEISGITKINFMQQISESTCTSACAAMLLNYDIHTVVKNVHDDFLKGKIDIVQYLNGEGLVASMEYSVLSRLKFGNIYVLCVPSLNKIAGNHNIIVDFRDVLSVYDPQNGREGKKYYMYGDVETDNRVELGGFCVDAVITSASYEKYIEMIR